jgi:hypothetical protein
MTDYRASNTGPSPYWQQLAADIKKGDTPYQKRQAWRDRAIAVGAQAGLQGIAGLASASHSYTNEMDQKRNEMKKAIMASAIGDAQKQDQFNRTFRPETYAQPGQQTGDAPSWLGQHGEGDVAAAAEAAKANATLNDAALNAPIGGVRTQQGQDNHSAQAGVLANDMATAQQGIRMGGMANSQVYRDPTDEYFGTSGGGQ